MRWRSLALILTILACVAQADTSSTALGDWLQKAWEAERQANWKSASNAYAEALILRPDDAMINLKLAEMLIYQQSSEASAPYLVAALQGFCKDPKSPDDLKHLVADVLMGRMPAGWRNQQFFGYYSPPYSYLSEETKKKIQTLVPREWLYASKTDQAAELIKAGKVDGGVDIVKDVVLSGDWRTGTWLLASKLLTQKQRTSVLQSWRRDAQKSRSPFLSMVVLQAYSSGDQVAEFKSALPECLDALRTQPGLLSVLLDLCQRMRWDDEVRKIRPLLPAGPASAKEALESFTKSLADKNLARTELDILRITGDYPDQSREVIRSENIRQMLRNGWDDLVIRLLPDESMRKASADLDRVLLTESVFNPGRFDYWIKRITSTDWRQDSLRWVILDAANNVQARQPEQAIWLVEQGHRISPKDASILGGLAKAYAETGYTDKGLGMLREPMEEQVKVGTEIDHEVFAAFWAIGRDARKLDKVTGDLWEWHDKLSVTCCVEIAWNCVGYTPGGDEAALAWIDEAARHVEVNGWTGDAEVMAKYSALISDNRQAEAQEFRKTINRSVMLYEAGTYEMRMRLLLKLGRKVEALKVYEEAKKIYPHFPFEDHIEGMAAAVPINWEQELPKAKERLRAASMPGSQHPPCQEIMRLAFALATLNKDSEADSLSGELMPLLPRWQKTLPLASAMFKLRLDALLPFASYSTTVPRQSGDNPLGGSVSLWTSAISTLGDKSLAGSYAVAAPLLSHIDFNVSDTTVAHRDLATLSWADITEPDRAVLKTLLSKQKLNPGALELMSGLYMREDKSWKAWISGLISSQTGTAVASIAKLKEFSTNSTPFQVRDWLDGLEKSDDWTGVRWDELAGIADGLAFRYMKAEAIRLVKAAISHAPESSKKAMQTELAKLSSSREAAAETKPTTSADWLASAAKLRYSKPSEAPTACVRALDSAKTLRERADALALLAEIDPADGIKRISRSINDFLVVGDNTSSLYRIADGLVNAAYANHDYASKVIPLLDRAVEFSSNMRENCDAKRAVVHLIAGDTERGLDLLFTGAGERYQGIGSVLGTCVRGDIPPAASTAVNKRLAAFLESAKPSLSDLSEAIYRCSEISSTSNSYTRNGVEVYNTQVSPGGVKSVAVAMENYAAKQPSVVPLKLLERVGEVNVSVQERKDLPSDCGAAWYHLFEALVKKSADSPDAAKSSADWLKGWLEWRSGMDFGKTKLFAQMQALAKSIEAGK